MRQVVSRTQQVLSHRLAAVILVLATLLQAPAVFAADWLYTIRPNDRLWTLAEKFCGTHTRWRDLAQHNQLAQPYQLNPGSQIRIPLEWLIEEPALVRLVYVRGDVAIEESGVNTQQAATNGAELGIGSKVMTGADSYANLEFADGSTLQIGPETEVVFDTLSAYRDTGMVDSRIRMNRGSGTSEVAPQRGPGAVYRISTPLGVAAVRGTRFRTRSVGDTSFVETVEGSVEYTGGAASNLVERGFGLKADPQGVAVETLLPPPTLAGARAYGNHEALEWSGLADAASYLVRIYSGPDRSVVLASASVAKPQYTLASLAPGNYAFGVRAIAASGLQGFEATQPLTIQQTIAAPQSVVATQPKGTRDLVVSWQAVEQAAQYTLTATPKTGGAPIVRTTTEPQLVLKDLDPARYSLSVQASAGEIVSEASAPTEQRVSRRSAWGVGGIVLAVLLAL